VLEDRLSYAQEFGEPSEPVGGDSGSAGVSIRDINRPAALGGCGECAAAGGVETRVIDATRIQYLKTTCDRYGKPAAMVSFFHPNGQRFLAPPLSLYTLKCVCESDGSVLKVPEPKDPQTETSKFKIIRRFERVEDEDGKTQQACPPGALLMRWSCGRTTWPDQGTNVNAGLPVKGNEEFGDDSEKLYQVSRQSGPHPHQPMRRKTQRRISGDGPRIFRSWVFPSGSRDFQNNASYCLTLLYRLSLRD
jgi:hypothetical protein